VPWINNIKEIFLSYTVYETQGYPYMYDDDDDEKGFTLFRYNDVTVQACRKGVGTYTQHSTKYQVHLLLLFKRD
jgi:hypothetical protein